MHEFQQICCEVTNIFNLHTSLFPFMQTSYFRLILSLIHRTNDTYMVHPKIFVIYIYICPSLYATIRIPLMQLMHSNSFLNLRHNLIYTSFHKLPSLQTIHRLCQKSCTSASKKMLFPFNVNKLTDIPGKYSTSFIFLAKLLPCQRLS